MDGIYIWWKKIEEDHLWGVIKFYKKYMDNKRYNNKQEKRQNWNFIKRWKSHSFILWRLTSIKKNVKKVQAVEIKFSRCATLRITQHKIKVKVYRRKKIFIWKMDRRKQSTLAEWTITGSQSLSFSIKRKYINIQEDHSKDGIRIYLILMHRWQIMMKIDYTCICFWRLTPLSLMCIAWCSNTVKRLTPPYVHRLLTW